MQAGNRSRTGEVSKKHSVEKHEALGPLRVWQTAEDGTSVLALQSKAGRLVKPLDNHTAAFVIHYFTVLRIYKPRLLLQRDKRDKDFMLF